MAERSQFSRAFWAGLAAPVSLFASAQNYTPHTANFSLQNSFAQVGNHLSQAFRQTRDGTTDSTAKSE